MNQTKDDLENYFLPFRENIIGLNHTIKTPHGEKRIIYADWTASGRNYLPIEKKLIDEFMPYVANTHSETSTTGMMMTYAYQEARQIIRKHVNATEEDVIVLSGSGMTKVINKLQRILDLKVSNLYRFEVEEIHRPVVFITHLEHHSNHTSWLETIADVEIIQPLNEKDPDLTYFKFLLEKYSHRSLKIASVSGGSNVTGVIPDYYTIAEMIHEYGGYCFVDFACSAPYIEIDMHPANRPNAYLDAIFFSPHKFLGGPGTPGVLVFNRKLYQRRFPDEPGGGTVDWTNPWGGHKYVDDIDTREDGGTPPFLQSIKAALAIKLKEKMNPSNILTREHYLLDLLWKEIENLPNVHILAPKQKDRLAILSFYIDDLHYNLLVRILNDYFGIQVRGGCSCAGTYGHYLLNIDQQTSKSITDLIDQGDFSQKPGWVRISLHPTMTDEEVLSIAKSIVYIAENHPKLSNDYIQDYRINFIQHRSNDVHEQIKRSIAQKFEV
ncbi:MAG: aminotransferase class V-fold PLP-dependent enzyme [Bacteroidia bacterium]|nr:aminotransferase class V-fold PLP-dependent enzyme [Bacteroidia bacterium]